jgi:hypothetical protein
MMQPMRWRKLGHIFVARQQSEWLHSHATVPFARQVARFQYRVYFSPRDRANRTSVCWLDIDIRQPTKILTISPEPVLRPGARGFFDDNGAMVSWLVDRGTEDWLYYQGWNVGVKVPFHVAIGLAKRSLAGPDLQFERFSVGPLVDRSVHEPVFVSNPAVLPDPAGWRMWYISGQPWCEAAPAALPRYHIRTVASRDGVAWDFPGADAITFAHAGEVAIARFCPVRESDGQFSAWYSFRGDDWGYRMGYARSPDGVRWERLDDKVGIAVDGASWEAPAISYPHVFDTELGRYMLYSAGRYASAGIGIAVLEQD